MKLTKYSVVIGDYFVHQESAELDTIIKADAQRVQITLMGNESNHEHHIVVTTPEEVSWKARSGPGENFLKYCTAFPLIPILIPASGKAVHYV